MFITGLFVLTVLVVAATVFSMVTMNPFIYQSKGSPIVVVLAAGSWFTTGATVLIAIIMFISGKPIHGTILFFLAGAIVLLNLAGQSRIVKINNKPVLTLATVNVLVRNPDGGKKIGSEIAYHNPDIVFIQEYDANVGDKMEMFLKDYTYCFIADKDEEGLNDLAIYSKYPLENKRVNYVANRPVLLADIVFEEQKITIACVHTMSPTSSERTLVWFDELDCYRSLFAMSTPLIIAGDFNATMSHAPFRNLVRASNLKDTTSWNTSWSNSSALPDYLHLDHILTSVDFNLTEKATKTTGEGSDHAPLIVKLQIIN